jgi:Clostripain family
MLNNSFSYLVASRKRRNFLKYAALSSICCTGILGSYSSGSIIAKSEPPKLRRDWVILYWMPYDNDLVDFGEPIIEMLSKATKSSNAVAIVQSDYFGNTKMRRRILINGDVQEIGITEEDSSNISTFLAYLKWAEQTFDAKHWAIIIVGHGGQVNEISPDDHGSDNRRRTWLKVDQLASAVNAFNQSTNGRVELLFFQNCNKATLEVIYETRNCARYTLASQLLLGAPNYYYEGFFKCLNKPLINGYDAAIAIIESESSDMYHTLTLVDNKAIKNLTPKLSRLIKLLLDNRTIRIDISTLSTIHYFGEQCCDVLLLFRELSQNIKQASNAFIELENFLKSSVIAQYKTGGELYGSRRFRNNNFQKFCGLSLYLPETKQDIYRYSSLALYQKLDLVNLYRKILAKKVF